MLPLRIHPKLLKWNQNFVTGGVLFYFVLLSRYLSTQNDPVMTRTLKIRLKCIFKSSAHLFFSNFIMSACFVICSKNQIFLCKKRLTDLQHFKMCPVNLVVGMFRLPVVLEEWNPLFSFFYYKCRRYAYSLIQSWFHLHELISNVNILKNWYFKYSLHYCKENVLYASSQEK